jgi:hypothetical protein
MLYKRISFVVAAVLVIGSQAFAQDTVRTASPKINYMNIFYSGGLFAKEGEGTTFTFTTIHGVRFGRLSAGVGVGLDFYQYWRALPVTGSVAVDIAKFRGSAFFIQAQAGYAWMSYWDPRLGAPDYDSRGGFTLNPLIGYRINADKFSIYIAGGYKYQKNRYTSEPYGPYSGVGTFTTSVDETRNRLVLQIGVGLH